MKNDLILEFKNAENYGVSSGIYIEVYGIKSVSKNGHFITYLCNRSRSGEFSLTIYQEEVISCINFPRYKEEITSRKRLQEIIDEISKSFPEWKGISYYTRKWIQDDKWIENIEGISVVSESQG